MDETRQLVKDYVALWNEDDDERRLHAVARCFTEDATYTDPLADVRGHEAISAMVGALRASHAGYSLRLASTVDEHHDHLRFEWEILDAEGGPYLTGVDAAVVGPDGRFASIIGFFGANPDRLAA